MLGPAMAIFRPFAALVSGLLSGLAVNILDKETHNHLESVNTGNDKNYASIMDKVKSAMEYGFVTLPSDIVVPLFQGLVIATLISIFLPPDFVAENFSSGMLLPAMLLISIPLYVCATASIPIAVALMAKGITVGAVFVFLMAGPATNASSITVIKKILGKKVMFQYLTMISLTSLLFGFMLDNFFRINIISSIMSHQHEHGSYWQIFTGLLFLVVMINAYIFKKTNLKIETDGSSTKPKLVVKVDGMTCSHCASSVKNAVLKSSGIDDVQVDLEAGEVAIYGEGFDADATKDNITKVGFNVR